MITRNVEMMGDITTAALAILITAAVVGLIGIFEHLLDKFVERVSLLRYSEEMKEDNR